MFMMRRTALAVLLSLILFLASAAPVWAAGDFWFAKLKYFEVPNGYEVAGEIISDSPLQGEGMLLNDQWQSVGPVVEAGESTMIHDLHVQPFSGVTQVVYDPLYVSWDEKLSIPISPGIDFSNPDTDLVYYVGDEQLSEEQVHILLVAPGEDQYVRYPNNSEALRVDVSQPGFVKISRLSDEIQFMLELSPEDVDVVIMIKTEDQIYLDQSYDPQLRGRIIPLTDTAFAEVDIQLPEEKQWNVHTGIFIPKDASGRPIAVIPASTGTSLPAEYTYDIGVTGTESNSNDYMLLFEENVELKAGETTSISFDMDALELVTWDLNWTIDESLEFQEEDFLFRGIGVGMQDVIPAIVTDPEEDQIERLYVVGGLHSELYFQYCMWNEDCYEYQVHMPASGETVVMDTDFRSMVQLEKAWVQAFIGEMEVPVSPFLHITDLQVEDGFGNRVASVDLCDPYCNYVGLNLDLVLEHLEEEQPELYEMIQYFPISEKYMTWVSEYPAYGLYRVTADWWGHLPITTEPTYLYVHEDLNQLVASVWPELDVPETVRDVQSLLREQFARFDEDVELRKTQIRLLMSLIDSGLLQESYEVPIFPKEYLLILEEIIPFPD